MKQLCEKDLNYGIIGNCRSGALVSDKGSIDWLCLPKFDSASVFGKILDDKNGGSFEIITETESRIIQTYDGNTNILITRFHCEDGVFEVHDFMPRYKLDNGQYYTPPDLIRFFKHVEGAPKFRIKFNPRLEYGRFDTKIQIYDKYVKAQTTKGNYDSMYLYTSMNNSDVACQQLITLYRDEFILVSYNQKLLKQTMERSYMKLMRTKAYWLTWSNRTTHYGKYNDIIDRSALVLKLLSYQKTGAVLAALTTSLPETIGEVRNWDYRFCWIRDASMVIKIMSDLDHHKLANRYLNFITHLLPEKDEKIQIMYGINGEKKLTEFELDHLEGYCGSKPVRIGNAAYKQKQNDIYGILMDVIYQHFHLFSVTLEHSEELWTITRNMVRSVQRNWHKPDKGIWEMRQNNKHFTFSKVLCWVAIDRAVKIASLLQQNKQVDEWLPLRDKIKADIMENAWSEEKQSFTQAYGHEDLDASVLLMETYGFMSPQDPKYVSTVLAIQKELEHKDLMYRYKNKDDFGEPSSAFTICSFWLIKSLYMIGRKEEAIEKFEKLLSYSNHLGLFSEDLDFETKRLLGNFPQAYSHLALIETAMILGGGQLSREEILLQMLH
ncbi:glycoside hydrolase family 15 protein [Alkalitalea saponilacus]|uniref:Glucoamylase (Glucan-1,4-alpha-glucosidase), GH15 family n=2 Tax=Alkalitalea saponilacus TaxID=889453 RepID=A0A1T5HKP8_9BACT|nr:glycoside hydrolase family 15 protein [Alkalitalea saponilacus]ASB47770.1 glycoside hydrolase [Alkalitalea saponilacus]SKC21130.1 Glucoamylase (glucan-1,4-alpha-glucosidase), GH15 family [Alkalitalea saponilacus]